MKSTCCGPITIQGQHTAESNSSFAVCTTQCTCAPCHPRPKRAAVAAPGRDRRLTAARTPTLCTLLGRLALHTPACGAANPHCTLPHHALSARRIFVRPCTRLTRSVRSSTRHTSCWSSWWWWEPAPSARARWCVNSMDENICACLGDHASTRGDCPYEGARPLPYERTIAVKFVSRTVRVGRTPIKLQIWDADRLLSFRALTTTYYRGVHGVALVFDVYDAASWHEVQVLAAGFIHHLKADARVRASARLCSTTRLIILRGAPVFGRARPWQRLLAL